jgi:hypothetical protein
MTAYLLVDHERVVEEVTNMGLKEKVKKDIDELQPDELVVLSEQIRLLKRARALLEKALPLEEIQRLTASSKSTWAEDITRDRQERG